MRLTSILAIYTLFWTLCLFLVLPWFARTTGEAGGEYVPGQAESAPHRISPSRIVLWTTLVSAILFGLYYANYVYGLVTADMFDWIVPEIS